MIPIPRGFWLFSKMSQIWFILKMTNTLPATSYMWNAFWVHSYIKIKMMVYTSGKYTWLLRVLNAISLEYNESSTFFGNAFLCEFGSYCCYLPFLNSTRSFETICIFDKEYLELKLQKKLELEVWIYFIKCWKKNTHGIYLN